MKIAVLNYSGSVGKTTVASHLLAPRLANATIFAVESTNETAADLGLEVEQVRGDRFGELYKSLLASDDAIVDVGASNIESFLYRMTRYEDAHLEIDYYLVPTIPNSKAQRETLKTVRVLAAAGIEPEKIRVVFNRVDADVEVEFAETFAMVGQERLCVASPTVAIFDNEVFDMLSSRKMTIDAILADDTDYRALLKSAKDEADVSLFTDMLAFKALAKPVKRNLDKVYLELFG